MTAREKGKRSAGSAATMLPDGKLFARLSEAGSICSYPRDTVLQTEGARIDTVYPRLTRHFFNRERTRRLTRDDPELLTNF